MKKSNKLLRKLLLELAEEYGCMDSSNKEEQKEAITKFKEFVIRLIEDVFNGIAETEEPFVVNVGCGPLDDSFLKDDYESLVIEVTNNKIND